MVTGPTDLLTDPDAFFRDVADDDGLRGPALVVFLLGVVSAVSGIPVAEVTADLLPPEAAAFAGFSYVATVVGGFVGAFVVWLVYAAVFHFVSSLAFEGDGPFTRTLAVAGWGLAPAVLVGIVSGFLTYLALRAMTIPSGPAGGMAFLTQLQRSPYYLAASLLGILGLLWQAYIWVHGVKHARGVELRDAAITVAVPAGVALVWRLYGLV